MHKLLATTIYSLLVLTACGDPLESTGPQGQTPGPGPGGKGDIIGEDDRRDEYADDVTDRHRELARSTAMVIANESLVPDGQGFIDLVGDTLGHAYSMCEDAPFREQPVTGFCSAWLVAPDVVVTNGHCITSQHDCDGASFVFDYAITAENQNMSRVPADTVVACERVLAWDYTSQCDIDWAVIKLARPVTDRAPLSVRRPGQAFKTDDLVIIGHPFGIARKYALNGRLIQQGDNVFTTTHDIIGGNSGSAIIDVGTGEVQGLVTCGGSNFDWFVSESGDAFEEQTGGYCTREQQHDEETCTNMPWLCPTPLSQFTDHFVGYIADWQIASNDEALAIAPYTEELSVIEFDADGVLQAVTVYLDFLGDQDRSNFLGEFIAQELDITLWVETGGELLSFDLVADSVIDHGTGFNLANVPGTKTLPLSVPFMIPALQLADARATYMLQLTNKSGFDHQLHGWYVQAIVKPDPRDVEPLTSPCLENCNSLLNDRPAPIYETFEGPGVDVDHHQISGTLAEGWDVAILFDYYNAADYEVIKTRRAQTLSLRYGEFAITKDFGQDIGRRNLIVDYRYDGEGWFQIRANDQLVYGISTFSQTTASIPLPEGTTSLTFVLGSGDDTRFDELTLYSLELSF
jgi:hypothetical protein